MRFLGTHKFAWSYWCRHCCVMTLTLSKLLSHIYLKAFIFPDVSFIMYWLPHIEIPEKYLNKIFVVRQYLVKFWRFLAGEGVVPFDGQIWLDPPILFTPKMKEQNKHSACLSQEHTKYMSLT